MGKKKKATRKKTRAKNSKKKKPVSKKPVKKVSKKSKKKKPVSKKKPAKKKSTKKQVKKSSKKKVKASLIARRPRGQEQIEFSFKGVKKLSDKIKLFKKESKKAIAKQLKRKDEKPPRAIIVVVEGKKGKGRKAVTVDRAVLSQPQFVVNQKSTEDFAIDFLDSIEEDYNERIDFHQTDAEEIEDSDDGLADEGYGDFDPDTISSITIKFFY